MPTLYIISGANGSGKTTFAMEFSIIKGLEFINADEIAKEFDPYDIEKHKIKAGKEFFNRLNKNIEKNETVVIESTLSGKYLFKIMHYAKEKGYYIHIMYLYLDTYE